MATGIQRILNSIPWLRAQGDRFQWVSTAPSETSEVVRKKQAFQHPLRTKRIAQPFHGCVRSRFGAVAPLGSRTGAEENQLFAQRHFTPPIGEVPDAVKLGKPALQIPDPTGDLDEFLVHARESSGEAGVVRHPLLEGERLPSPQVRFEMGKALEQRCGSKRDLIPGVPIG